MSLDKNTNFVKALGRVPSGLFIVVTQAEQKRAAYLASFAQQVSFDPLLFAVACHPDRLPYQLIQQTKKFSLNILPENDQVLMKTFAKGHGPDEDPCETVATEEINGVTVLKDALGAAVFEVVDEVKPGDHAIFFGRAIDGEIFDESLKPWTHVRKSALSY